MKLEDFLDRSGMTKAAVADFCQVTRSALTKWEEVPDKHMVLLSSFLKEKVVTDETVNFLTKEEKRRQDRKAAGIDLDDYGSGSEWDREYSASKIEFIRKMLTELGSVSAVYDWIRPVQFERSFIEDVHKNVVEPR